MFGVNLICLSDLIVKAHALFSALWRARFASDFHSQTLLLSCAKARQNQSVLLSVRCQQKARQIMSVTGLILLQRCGQFEHWLLLQTTPEPRCTSKVNAKRQSTRQRSWMAPPESDFTTNINRSIDIFS